MDPKTLNQGARSIVAPEDARQALDDARALALEEAAAVVAKMATAYWNKGSGFASEIACDCADAIRAYTSGSQEPSATESKEQG